MRAWTAPDVPILSQPGPAVRLYDTSAQELVDSGSGREARIYVCGITPYDATHMGHAATYVAFDLLLRAWRNHGLAVHYVQNVTDVDDPLLERAEKVHIDWVELAERETELFRQDLMALRVIPPQEFIGAVESIGLVIDLIGRLQETGSIYEVDGDLYFSVTADPAFGAVSGWDRAMMTAVFGERGGDPDRPGKRDPLDCVVWRAERPGEPAGRVPTAGGVPGGTSSAPRSPANTSVRRSTCRPAAAIWSSPITRCAHRKPRWPSQVTPSQRHTCTQGWSGTPGRRCPSPAGISCSSRTYAIATSIRWPSG